MQAKLSSGVLLVSESGTSSTHTNPSVVSLNIMSTVITFTLSLTKMAPGGACHTMSKVMPSSLLLQTSAGRAQPPDPPLTEVSITGGTRVYVAVSPRHTDEGPSIYPGVTSVMVTTGVSKLRPLKNSMV